jgi:IS5 family transposase
MVRILVLKRLYNLSDEQMEYQLLVRMSYKRFCGLANATNIPDRTTVWTFENRIGEAGVKALFDGVSAQLLKKSFIARGGQIIDATLVPAPTQHSTRGERELIDQSGFRSQIQRKGHRNKLLSDCQQRRTKRIARTRARVGMCSGPSTRWAASCFVPSARRGRTL